jgi:hypothetical protein
MSSLISSAFKSEIASWRSTLGITRRQMLMQVFINFAPFGIVDIGVSTVEIC